MSRERADVNDAAATTGSRGGEGVSEPRVSRQRAITLNVGGGVQGVEKGAPDLRGKAGGGDGPAKGVLRGGRCGKAARERRRPQAAEAGGPAGGGCGGAADLEYDGVLPRLRRWTAFPYLSSPMTVSTLSPFRQLNSCGHLVGIDRGHGCR
jgi:hypothetical protein